MLYSGEETVQETPEHRIAALNFGKKFADISWSSRLKSACVCVTVRVQRLDAWTQTHSAFLFRGLKTQPVNIRPFSFGSAGGSTRARSKIAHLRVYTSPKVDRRRKSIRHTQEVHLINLRQLHLKKQQLKSLWHE